ncbi:MAG: peptidoglycan editing factor PgeF [Lachnospiraceae bacterium]|nr:peptidoglycan editing factor PgeF [Lachnospiraceae bacterium]
MEQLLRKESSAPVRENWSQGVLYFTFPLFEQFSFLTHGFSSRLGGVSEKELGEMNLSYTRGDLSERVEENFRRIADAIGFPYDRMVFSHQTHTTNVREVTRKDCGKGYLLERDYQEVDGLVTNDPGVVLTTFYADCVPLYFVDPIHRAIGLAHSGWKGTVHNIARVTVEKMQSTYGTDPASLFAAIGPSICQDCYEVGEDVASQFRAHYPESVRPLLLRQNSRGKYQLNLWEACRYNLQNAGLIREHIFVTDLCTCCNPEVLFSHRASHGKRGNLAAFLAIRDWQETAGNET